MNNSKAFTLIELLVVIAIIGMLSNIVLVNTRSSREKARIAKALKFNSTIQHTLGAYAIGIWRFEETDNTALDSSGYGNNATIYGAIHQNGILNKALSFDGINDYVQTVKNFSIDTSKSGYTISAWIYETSSNGYSWNTVAGLGMDSVALGMNTRNGNVVGAWACGYQGTTVVLNNFQNGWHHMSVVFIQNISSFTPAQIYFDGIYVGNSVTDRSTPCIASSTFQIAKSYAGYSSSFKGIIDDVYFYDRELSSAEIQQHYAQGLEKHRGLVIK